MAFAAGSRQVEFNRATRKARQKRGLARSVERLDDQREIIIGLNVWMSL